MANISDAHGEIWLYANSEEQGMKFLTAYNTAARNWCYNTIIESNTIRYIHIHNDGYPWGVGRALFTPRGHKQTWTYAISSNQLESLTRISVKIFVETAAMTAYGATLEISVEIRFLLSTLLKLLACHIRLFLVLSIIPLQCVKKRGAKSKKPLRS